MKAIVNADIIVDGDILKGYGVLFEDRIIEIAKDSDIRKESLEELYDAGGRYLSPGFIDVHIHGCLGDDTMDENDTSLIRISQSIASTGVTGFLPTTMTMDFALVERTLERIRKYIGGTEGASILGCHLEGPFISKEYKGAHDEKYILSPEFGLLERFSDVIKIVTLAPEMEGSAEFIESCARCGIVASIGHTKASYSQAMDAIAKGASHFTHTFNAMTPLHHREPGVVGAVMDSPASCELITDNIHVAPPVQRILLKTKGIDNIVLVTDAMKACLLADGEYELGGQRVFVKDGAARVAAGNLAGSVLTMNRALKNFIDNTGVSLAEAVKTITVNPSRLLRLEDRKGSIAIGKDADLTIFDSEYNIYKTFVKGKKVYERLSHENSSC